MKDFLMTLDWPALIGTIWTVVLLPLVLYAKNKIDEVAKAHKVEKYSKMLYTAVEYVVKDILTPALPEGYTLTVKKAE